MGQRKKQKKRKRVSLWRWIFFFALSLLFYFAIEHHPIQLPEVEGPIQLYSTQCHDDLEALTVAALENAQRTIYLVTYSLNDKSVIESLNQQASQGKEISVKHDVSSPQKGFYLLSPAIHLQPCILSKGLMHQKLLVIDESWVWLGSANMTKESLRLHDNLVACFPSAGLAYTIRQGLPFFRGECQGQPFTYWAFPEEGEAGLHSLLNQIRQAKKILRIAMYTWTHQALTEAVIEAHKRGVHVEVLLDRGQAEGACGQAYKRLVKAGIPLRLKKGKGLCHHKFAWIDGQTLALGSANWTQAAFKKNQDCLVMIESLTETQNAYLTTLWQRGWAVYTAPYARKKIPLSIQEQHLPVFGQRPIFIREDLFQFIPMAA